MTTLLALWEAFRAFRTWPAGWLDDNGGIKHLGVEEAKQYSFLVKKKRRKLKENPYKIQGVRSRPEQECRTCPFVRSLSVRTLAVLIYSCHNSFSIKLMEFSLTKNFFLINSFLQMHRERYRKTCEIILTVGKFDFHFEKE